MIETPPPTPVQTPKPKKQNGDIPGFIKYLQGKGFTEDAINKKVAELGGQLNRVSGTTNFSSLSSLSTSPTPLEVVKPNEAFKSLAKGVANEVPTILQGIADIPMLTADLIAPDSEIATSIRSTTQKVSSWLDSTKFDIPSSNDKGFFEWTDDGFKINSFSDMSASVGQGVGSLLSIFLPAKALTIPSIAAKIGKAGISMNSAQKLTSFISGTLGMIEPVYDQATAAGLDPRDRAGITVLTAPIISLMDTMFGVESMIIAGKGVTKKTITNLAGEALDSAIEKTLAKNITGETFQKEVAKAAISKYAFALSKLKGVATEGMTEGIDEASQEFVEKAIQYGYDKHLSKPNSRYDVDLFGKDSVKDYVNSAFMGGLLGSGMGAFFKTAPMELEKTLFGHIQNSIENGRDANIQSVRDKVDRMISLDPENQQLVEMKAKLSKIEYVASETANNEKITPDARFQIYSIAYNEIPSVNNKASELNLAKERFDAVNLIDTQTFENAEQNEDVKAIMESANQEGKSMSVPIAVGIAKRNLSNEVEGFDNKMQKLKLKSDFLNFSSSKIKSTGKPVNIDKTFSAIDKFSVGDEVSFAGNTESEKFLIDEIKLDSNEGIVAKLSNESSYPISEIREWTKSTPQEQPVSETTATTEQATFDDLIGRGVVLDDGLNTFFGTLSKDGANYELNTGDEVYNLGDDISDLNINPYSEINSENSDTSGYYTGEMFDDISDSFPYETAPPLREDSVGFPEEGFDTVGFAEDMAQNQTARVYPKDGPPNIGTESVNELFSEISDSFVYQETVIEQNLYPENDLYPEDGLFDFLGSIYYGNKEIPSPDGQNEVFEITSNNGGNIKVTKASKKGVAVISQPEKIKEVLDYEPEKQETPAITIEDVKAFFGLEPKNKKNKDGQAEKPNPRVTETKQPEAEVSEESSKVVLEKSEELEASTNLVKRTGGSKTRRGRIAKDVDAKLRETASEIERILDEESSIESVVQDGANEAVSSSEEPISSDVSIAENEQQAVQDNAARGLDSEGVLRIGDNFLLNGVNRIISYIYKSVSERKYSKFSLISDNKVYAELKEGDYIDFGGKDKLKISKVQKSKIADSDTSFELYIVIGNDGVEVDLDTIINKETVINGVRYSVIHKTAYGFPKKEMSSDKIVRLDNGDIINISKYYRKNNQTNTEQSDFKIGQRVSALDQVGVRFKVADIIAIDGDKVTVTNGKTTWVVSKQDLLNPPQLQKTKTQATVTNIVEIIAAKFPSIRVEFMNSEQFMDRFGNNAFGAFFGDTVYLNEDRYNDSTVVHEFGHVWAAYVKYSNPSMYLKALNLVKDSDYEKIVRMEYPELTDIADILDEAIAYAIQDNFEYPGESTDLLAKMKSWFNSVIDSLRSFFGMEANVSQKESIKSFYSKISSELLDGKAVIDFVTEENGTVKFQKYSSNYSSSGLYTGQKLSEIGQFGYTPTSLSKPISSQKTSDLIEAIEADVLLRDIASQPNPIAAFKATFGEIVRDFVKEGGKNGLFKDANGFGIFTKLNPYNMNYQRFFVNGVIADNVIRDLINEFNSGSNFDAERDSHIIHRGIASNGVANFIDPNTGKIAQNIINNLSAELNQPLTNRPTFDALSRVLSADTVIKFVDSNGNISDQFLDDLLYQYRTSNDVSKDTPAGQVWKMLKQKGFYDSWNEWDRDTHFVDENGNRYRFDADAEMAINESNINKMNNPQNRISAAMNFVVNNGLFRLNNLNQKTFGKRLGGNIEYILDKVQSKWNRIAASVRVENEEIDARINELFHKGKLSTFGGRNNEFTVTKKTISATNPETGVESDYEIEAAKLISIALSVRTQMASIGKSSAIYDPNDTSMPLDKGRGITTELVKGEGLSNIIFSLAQIQAIENMMMPGGELHDEFNEIKTFFNRDNVFSIINYTFREINGVSLKRVIDPTTGEPMYFPIFTDNEFDQAQASTQRLSGVDEDSIFRARTGYPKRITIKDPLAMIKQYREAVDDLVSHGVVLKYLENYATQMKRKWEMKGSNWRNELKFLEQRIETIRNYKELVFKDISRNVLEDGGMYSKLMGNYARSVFALNIGNPLKQMAGYFVSYGQDIVSNKNLSKSLGLLGKLTISSYAGFVQGEGNKRLSGIPTPELDLIEEIESNQYASELIYRVLGKGGANTNGVNLQAVKNTIATGGLASGSKVIAQGWNATMEWMDDYGLEAMQRSDRAVMLAFYNASKLEVKDEIAHGQLLDANGNLVTDINSDEAKKRIVELATDLTFATNQTSVLSDKTQIQLNRSPLVQAMIMFSSQQQKVMNLVIQNYYDWRNVDYNTNTPEWNRLRNSIVTGTLFNSMFIAGVTGFISLLKSGFDDEEWDKQLEQAPWELSRNIIGSFPTVGSEILQSLTTMIDPAKWENASGTSPVFDAINQMSRGVGASLKYAAAETEKEQDKLLSDMMFNIPSGFAKITGLPIFPVSVITKQLNKK